VSPRVRVLVLSLGSRAESQREANTLRMRFKGSRVQTLVPNEVKDLSFPAEDPSKLRMREARTLNF
jgi:hypothetical protein